MNQLSYINKKLSYWLIIVITITLLLSFCEIYFNAVPPMQPIADFWEFFSEFGRILGIGGLIVGVGFKQYFNQKLVVGSILLGFCIYLILLLTNSKYISPIFLINILAIIAPLGLTIFFSSIYQWKMGNKNILKLYFYITLLIFCMGKGTDYALALSQYILPATYDSIIYKLDDAFFGVRHHMVLWLDHMPAWFFDFVVFIYSSLTVFLFLVFALLIREGKAAQHNIVRTLIVPFGVAFLCYMFVPASGPLYAFRELFPNRLPATQDLQTVMSFIPPAPRNAMPSMHFSGAFLVWLLSAALNRKLVFTIATAFLILTIIATIGLGEHYLLDLIVASPFAIALGLALISPKDWFSKKSTRIAWGLAVFTFVFWMGSIIVMLQWLGDNLWFVQLLSVWSVAIAVYLTSVYLKLVWNAKPLAVGEKINETTNDMTSQAIDAGLGYPKWAISAFVISGFVGLLYEVVYAKSLAITFGSTSLAPYTVLVTYMGGMALGAWIGGIFADKVKNPLMYYIGIEAIIGLYAVLTPLFFKLIQVLYLSFVGDLPPDAQSLTVVRVMLGALVLGIPTVLMGATVPFMFKYLKTFGITTESALSKLYSANVVGAALGSLIGAYVLLPTLGRIGATNLAAAISLLLALYVMEQAKKNPTINHNHTEQATTMQVGAPKISRSVGLSALIVLTIGGGVTLGLEVVSIHMLAVVAGNSVYAFGLMLATFLVGLSFGSIVGERILHYINNRYTIVLAQCGVCISIILTAFLWDRLPIYFASFGYMQQFLVLGFGAREIIRGAVCALAMFPAAFFIGINYPAAMSLASDFLFKKGEANAVGIASALNTFGNISGVLIVAFYALPTFGSNRVFIALAFLAFGLAILMFVIDNEKINLRSFGTGLALIGLVVSFGLFFVYPKQWDFNRLSQGANVYFAPVEWGEVIDYTESITGGITSVTISPDGHNLTLLTNGKFQGNNTGEVEAQESFALIPLLHTDKRDSALVIGYGTGMSARVLHDQHFKELDIAELSKDIVVIADKYFPDNNKGVSSQPNVNMYYTDGRNYLLTQDKNYDLISMEISSIWFAGAANLYNKEFYQLAKKRLNDDGILQQWVQLHHIHTQDLVYILNTVRSEFQYVWLYTSGGQGIIVASNSPEATNYHVLKPPYHNLTEEQLKQRSEKLVSGQILTPEGVDNLARTFDTTLRRIISTDNNLKLEYSTPKGNAITEDSAITMQKNIEFLHQFESKAN